MERYSIITINLQVFFADEFNKLRLCLCVNVSQLRKQLILYAKLAATTVFDRELLDNEVLD
jgi:hypothetical protein